MTSPSFPRGNLHWTSTVPIEITFGVTTLELPDARVLWPLREELEAGEPARRKWTYFYEDGFEVQHEAVKLDGVLSIETAVFCRARQGGPLARITVGRGTRLFSAKAFDHVYWQTLAMDGFSGVQKSPGSFESWGQVGITDSDGERAAVAGFTDFSSYDCRIAGERPTEANTWVLNPTCVLEGRRPAQDRALAIPTLRISTGTSLAELLWDYATTVGRKMKARTTAPAPVGWCSWYGYYGHETEAEILANLDFLARSFPKTQKPVFQIDDGWNQAGGGPGQKRVWGDWLPGGKFSEGMGAIAGKIRDRNFVPGLWLAPFSVARDSRFFADHPDWLVQKPGGKGEPSQPASVRGDENLFALDLTRPEVLDFVRTTFRRVFSEWGYDYAKIDFLQHALVPGRRWDAGQTPIEAFRAGLEVIRSEAGDDRFVLCCGSPFGASIGLCDGMRVGLDTGGGWNPPFTLPEWPNGNCSVLAAALPAFYRQWMHRTWWVNDPDCLIVRQEPLPWETQAFSEAAAIFEPVSEPSTCFVTDEEAQFSVRLIWMLGGAGISSDIWSALSKERLELLKAAFPPNPRPTIWIDWYREHKVCLLRTRQGPLCLGLFNHADQPVRVELPSAKVGLKQWKFTERFGAEGFAGAGETLSFPPVPRHAGRVWELQPS